MKEKIAAFISFIGSVAGLCWLLYMVIVFVDKAAEGEEFLFLFLSIALLISTILYIIWTRFGFKNVKELEQIDYENQLIKKKIEQQELLKKLEK